MSRPTLYGDQRVIMLIIVILRLHSVNEVLFVKNVAPQNLGRLAQKNHYSKAMIFSLKLAFTSIPLLLLYLTALSQQREEFQLYPLKHKLQKVRRHSIDINFIIKELG
ncbi:hypothetical protein K435DRAFT_800391 [Dendrothele bispora CBS 962.96]|uniref:Uncharacterized protein n=1 Tax=Dendrothele bispora (strain CBS 962.96) TaxID=1314807 RepID=A0A4S8LSU9_DENBC|nr:hypothetical protein K435DRAFT_800391 [Dendrothele bispora CBS 962.96]